MISENETKLHRQAGQNFQSGEHRVIKEKDQLGVLAGENATNSLTQKTLIRFKEDT